MRAFIPSGCLLLLTALGGCVGTSDPPQPIQENPNRFTYHTESYPYSIHFAPSSDTLSAEERQRLQGFLRASSARRDDKVTVSGETSPLGHRRSARVRDLLQRAGLDVAEGVDVNLSPNTVSLQLLEMVVAKPPKCGDWPLFAGDAPSNAPSLYLGCAMRNNLYEEVANKRDLAVGQTPGPADAEPGMRAVQQYREGTGDSKKKDDSASQNNGAAGGANDAANSAASLAGPAGSGGDNGQ